MSMLSTSVSKQQYSIPRSVRFPKIKTLTRQFSYASLEQLSDFDLTAQKARNRRGVGFGSKNGRFVDLKADVRDQMGLDSQNKAKEKQSKYFSQGRYSFGVSRERMCKVFVD